MMKLSVRVLAFCAALSLSLPSIGCDSAERKARHQHEEHGAQLAREVSDLSTRYNAVSNWQMLFKQKRFSIEAEPIFVRSDHRPILFYATLEDVRREHDAFMLYLDSTPTEGEPVVRLVLDCNGCDLQKLKAPSESFGDFAVVAAPTQVVKTIDGPENGPDFLINGKLIEAVYVDDYAFGRASSAILKP